MSFFNNESFGTVKDYINKNKAIISIITIFYFLPLFTTNTISTTRFLLTQLTTILIYSILAISFELQLGRTGLLNFGHAAFFGIGAYVSGLLIGFSTNLPILQFFFQYNPLISWITILILAIITGMLIGGIMGLTTSRMKGTTFAFVALAIAMVLYYTFFLDPFLSGGETGRIVPPPNLYINPLIYYIFSLIVTSLVVFLFVMVLIVDIKDRGEFLGFSFFSNPLNEIDEKKSVFQVFILLLKILIIILFLVALFLIYFFIIIPNVDGMNNAKLVSYRIINEYYFVLSCSILVYFFVKKLVNSPFGRVLAAISQNEERAEALGYNVYYYKIKSLGISGGIAGLAGALFAAHQGIINPDITLGVSITINAMLYSIIGGLNTLLGSFVGSFFVNLNLIFANINNDLWIILLGIFFILIVLFLPYGIVGTINVHSNWIKGILLRLKIKESDYWWISFVGITIILLIIISLI
ncbi:MAG: branched-chain amino acid ABC transporter permease [Candidatus Thorarchaeota archaeon]